MLAAAFRMMSVLIFVIHIFFVISGEAAEPAKKKSNPRTIYDQTGQLVCKVTGPTKMPDTDPSEIQGNNKTGRTYLIEACGPAVAECERHAKAHGANPQECRIVQLSYGSCKINVTKSSVDMNVGCSGAGYEIWSEINSIRRTNVFVEGIVRTEYCRTRSADCENPIERDRLKGAVFETSWETTTTKALPVKAGTAP